MWQTIKEAVIGTPAWVYVLFFFLLYRGYRACYPSITGLRKLFIIPLIFTAMSLHTLFTSFALNTELVFAWLVAILVGSSIGYLMIAKKKLRVDRENKLVALPGSSLTLVVLIIIFAAKYYFGYQIAAHPELLHKMGFALLDISISGAFTGLFVGRLGVYLHRYKTLPSENLKQ